MSAAPLDVFPVATEPFNILEELLAVFLSCPFQVFLGIAPDIFVGVGHQ
jgi:hypothetical protein